MNCPKVSIVTPVYNQAQYLEKTIYSLLQQNYPNLEYIIVDGGSTDGTLEIIKKYEDKLAYWISEKDNGMYEAIQKGFEKSTGEIMAWLNADDIYIQNSLYVISEIFTSFDQVNWLTGSNTFIDESDRIIRIGNSRNLNRYDFLSNDYKWIQQESTVWRRSLWEKAGALVNTELRLAGDFELWLRFLRYEKLYVIDAPIGAFRVRSSNQLSLIEKDNYEKEAFDILKDEIASLDKRDYAVLSAYKRAKKTFDFLAKFRLFSTDKMMNKYKKNTFGFVPSIDFNRMTQQFDLSEM